MEKGLIMKEKIMEIPKYGVKVEIWFTDDGQVDGGVITSKLHRGSADKYDAAMDGVELMVLNCAVSMFDITSAEFLEALDATVEFVKDQYEGCYE